MGIPHPIAEETESLNGRLAQRARVGLKRRATGRDLGGARLELEHLVLATLGPPAMVEVAKKAAMLVIDAAGEPTGNEAARFRLELGAQQLADLGEVHAAWSLRNHRGGGTA